MARPGILIKAKKSPNNKQHGLNMWGILNPFSFVASITTRYEHASPIQGLGACQQLYLRSPGTRPPKQCVPFIFNVPIFLIGQRLQALVDPLEYFASLSTSYPCKCAFLPRGSLEGRKAGTVRVTVSAKCPPFREPFWPSARSPFRPGKRHSTSRLTGTFTSALTRTLSMSTKRQPTITHHDNTVMDTVLFVRAMQVNIDKIIHKGGRARVPASFAVSPSETCRISSVLLQLFSRQEPFHQRSPTTTKTKQFRKK